MAQQYTLSRRAIMKMILHAAKYPHRAVNGVIIGTVASDRSVEMVDAVPLFHSHLALAPMLETALFQVDAHIQDQKDLKIVGYYQANERIDDTDFSQAGRRIADAVNNNCPQACALVLDNSEIQNYLQQDSAKICELYTRDKGWNRQQPGPQLQYSDAGVPDILLEYIRDNKHLALADFEEHLEDLSRDWLNPDLLS